MSQQDLHESKGRHVCMPSSCGLTHQQKNILLPSSTHPCSRALAKASPQSSSASSFAKRHSSSPSSHTRGILLFWSGALLLQSIWLSLAHMKGDVFCASNHRTNGACHQGSGFLHTSRVCDPALQSLESAWSMCPPLLQLAPKMLESSTIKYDHATSSAIARHPSYMQVVSALRYVTPSSPISI